ncbi:helix-turn-helix transcriptional regulator [Sphaerothrix gracilis]|uniref:helix-turn-helix domain-containing protein n=1 Tax=Sphaerothrix gracilis TaxID=3151835 RepID=UPI0031FD0BF2
MPLDLVPSLPSTDLPRSQPQVGDFVRELRQLMGYTQEQFSTLIGVSFSTLNRWEKGHMQPSPLALKQIESVFDELSQASNSALQAGRKALLEKYVSH